MLAKNDRRFRFAIPPALLCALLLHVHPPARAHGEELAPRAPAQRPKLGLALSGGSALAVSHIGVLKALEELRVPISYVTGTSMGAIIGGLYASGMSPGELEQWFRAADWHYLLSDHTPRASEPLRNKERAALINQGIEFKFTNDGLKLPAAFVGGRNIMAELRRLTVPVRDVEDFDNLPVPFRALATDLEKGDLVVLGEGDLAESIRASMSIPGVFLPQTINGRLLADGGMTNNLGISIVRQMGAEAIIAVDCGMELRKGADLDTAPSMAMQVVAIMMQQQTRRERALLAPSDVLLRVLIDDMEPMDFVKSTRGIDIGYETTMKSKAALARYSVSPAEFEQYLARQRVPRASSVPVAFVRVKTPKGESYHAMKQPVEFMVGDLEGREKLQTLVNDLGAMQAYEVADYEVLEENGAYGLLVEARQRKTGTHEMHFGFEFGYSATDEGDYNLLLAHRLLELNERGAEWRTYLSLGSLSQVDTEWYQPLDSDRRWFLAIDGLARSDFVDGSDAAGQRLRFRQEDWALGADLGMRLWQAGEVRVGYSAGVSEIHRRLGVPEDVPSRSNRGWLHAGLAIDTLDAPNFATKGFFANVAVVAARDELGADDEYTRIVGQMHKPLTIGRNTFVPRIGGSVKVSGDDVPLYDQEPLGGFLNLSGLQRGGLYGENFALAELVYYRKLAVLNPSTGRALYAGMSAEFGEVWGSGGDFRVEDATAAGSVFLGAETVFGGLYLGAGMAQGGHFGLYLRMGPIFGSGPRRHSR